MVCGYDVYQVCVCVCAHARVCVRGGLEIYMYDMYVKIMFLYAHMLE